MAYVMRRQAAKYPHPPPVWLPYPLDLLWYFWSKTEMELVLESAEPLLMFSTSSVVNNT